MKIFYWIIFFCFFFCITQAQESLFLNLEHFGKTQLEIIEDQYVFTSDHSIEEASIDPEVRQATSSYQLMDNSLFVKYKKTSSKTNISSLNNQLGGKLKKYHISNCYYIEPRNIEAIIVHLNTSLNLEQVIQLLSPYKNELKFPPDKMDNLRYYVQRRQNTTVSTLHKITKLSSVKQITSPSLPRFKEVIITTNNNVLEESLQTLLKKYSNSILLPADKLNFYNFYQYPPFSKEFSEEKAKRSYIVQFKKTENVNSQIQEIKAQLTNESHIQTVQELLPQDRYSNRLRIAFVPEILVTLKEKSKYKEFLNKYRGLIEPKEDKENNTFLCKLKDISEDVLRISKRIELSSSDLKNIVPNYYVELRRSSFFNNASNSNLHFDRQWYLRNIKVKGAWELSRGSGTTIGILDDGVDFFHPDLKPNIFVNRLEISANFRQQNLDSLLNKFKNQKNIFWSASNPGDGKFFKNDYWGWNFHIDKEKSPAEGNYFRLVSQQETGLNLNASKVFKRRFPTPRTGDQHGTGCAGIAASKGGGIIGVAPDSKIFPVKIIEQDKIFINASVVAAAIDYAANYCDVLNLSWHISPNDIITRAITKAANSGGPKGKGTVICCAVGNDGKSDRIDYPASLSHIPGVIAVGACDKDGTMNRYSNCNSNKKQVTLIAPSDPDRHERTENNAIFTTAHTNNPPGGYNEMFGGTSAATPMVAAVAALMRSANSNLTSAQIETFLVEETSPISGFTTSFEAGAGILNAAKAVLRAKNTVTGGTSSSTPPRILQPRASSSSLKAILQFLSKRGGFSVVAPKEIEQKKLTVILSSKYTPLEIAKAAVQVAGFKCEVKNVNISPILIILKNN